MYITKLNKIRGVSVHNIIYAFARLFYIKVRVTQTPRNSGFSAIRGTYVLYGNHVCVKY